MVLFGPLLGCHFQPSCFRNKRFLLTDAHTNVMSGRASQTFPRPLDIGPFGGNEMAGGFARQLSPRGPPSWLGPGWQPRFDLGPVGWSDRLLDGGGGRVAPHPNSGLAKTKKTFGPARLGPKKITFKKPPKINPIYWHNFVKLLKFSAQRTG